MYKFAAVLLVLMTGLVAHSPAQSKSSPIANLPCATTGPYVQTDGTNLTSNGAVLKLRGYTFYPATTGGTSAWHSTNFQAYEDNILSVGLSGGQNLIRPTDFWNKSTPNQNAFDPTVWANMDHLVCKAASEGVYVIMDLSAYKWLLVSQGQDPSVATNWKNFLDVIAHHYSQAPNIAFYSLVGEPAYPQSAAEDATLTAFYKYVTDEVAGQDKNHLISAGGFNNMNNGYPGWWKSIYNLAHNNVALFKTYSQHDIDLMPTILNYTHSITKPAIDEEFGMPQSLGDGSYSGQAYNGITTSRAQFYQTVYTNGENLATAGFVFWNLADLSGSTHYDVYPGTTPAVWQVIQQHGTAPVSTPKPCGA